MNTVTFKPWILSLVMPLVVTALPAVSASESVLYHNATLINPATEQQLTNGWLLVQDGRIVKMGQAQAASLPAASKQIDLQQQYVLPGLIDVHLHLTAGPHRVEMRDGAPVLTMAGHSEVTRYHAISTLATGVTTAFSPAGDPQANADYVQQQQAGQWLGPKLHYAGYVFEPTPIFGGAIYPTDEASWRAEIAKQQALGVDYIKLYTGLTADEVALGVRLAREARLKTIAHLDSVSWQYAADLGIDILTHALPTSAELLTGAAKAAYQAERKNHYNQRFIYSWFQHVDYDSEPMRRLITTLVKQQTRIDLTMVVNELFYFARELDAIYPEDAMWVFHPQMRQRWRALMAAPSYDWSTADFAAAQQQLPKVQALFKRLYDAGVPLAIGTDSTASGPFYLRELELTKAAGLSNWQVLQLATSGGAHHLGLTDHGQLKAGYVADFIVLAANPITDLHALNTLHTVVQQGNLMQVEALKAQLSSLSQFEF